MSKKYPLTMTVNDESVELSVTTHKTLLEVLREDMNLTGTKHGCELGECGVCTVLVNGKPVLSCLMLAPRAHNAEIKTIEGLAQGPILDQLQSAFCKYGAAQCGYCTPAMLLTAKALIERDTTPTVQHIQKELSGVLCRCTGYLSIINAVGSVCGLGDNCTDNLNA